jgi:hypothetical protein
LINRSDAQHVIWRVDHQRASLPPGRILRVELLEPAIVHLRNGGAATRDSGLGVHYVDLPTAELRSGDTIEFPIASQAARRPRRERALPTKSILVRVENVSVQPPA